MKGRKVAYWISTGLLSVMMAFFACLYLMHAPQIMAAFAHLGYPAYFANILGVAKLLGVATLLLPGARILKEWAYAGFTITFLSAFVSHLTSGDGPKALPALIALGLFVTSYFTRPAERAVAEVNPNMPQREIGIVPPPRPAHG